MRGQVCCGLWSIRVNASGLRGCIASSRQAARAGRESTPHQPAYVHCTRSTHNAHQSQANPAQNLRTRVAPCRQAARTNRKSTSYQSAHMRCTEPIRGARQTQVNSASTRTCALHRADRRRTPDVSQLGIDSHMRVVPSRQAARGKRKSTPHQPAHARCIEPTGGAHQTQVNFASIRTCALHRADTRRAPNTSQPRVEPTHARCTEPTRGAHQT